MILEYDVLMEETKVWVYDAQNKFVEYAMDMAKENEFEADANTGWGEFMTTDEGFITGWKKSAPIEDKVLASSEILSAFGFTVFSPEKDKLSLLGRPLGSNAVIFASAFDYHTEELEEKECGVQMKFFIDNNTLCLVFTSDDADGAKYLEKHYTLPRGFNDCRMGLIDVSKEKDRVEIEIVSYSGGKGTASFHFNGEGTLYNDFYIDGEEENEADWNGYFEIEDLVDSDE